MKKKIFLIVVLAITLCYAPNVFASHDILGCEAVLRGVSIDSRIVNIVHTVILGIQIAVPIVLVIYGMLDLFKGLTAQKEDEIKKGQQMLLKRIITAALVFFVIAIVKTVISFAAGQNDGTNILDCASCFFNGADDKTGVCK